MTQERANLDRVSREAKDQEVSRLQSEEALHAAIREAKSSHDCKWPAEVTAVITGHQIDLDRRTSQCNSTASTRKKIQAEVSRLLELIPQLVEDAREGRTLFEQDTVIEAKDAWRGVQLSDIVPPDTAQSFNGIAINTLGQLVDAGDVLLTAIKERRISKRDAHLAAKIMVEYAKDAKLTIGMDDPGEAPKEEDPADNAADKNNTDKNNSEPGGNAFDMVAADATATDGLDLRDDDRAATPSPSPAPSAPAPKSHAKRSPEIKKKAGKPAKASKGKPRATST